MLVFACGVYATYESFLESVEEETEQQVKRLRHHASLVICLKCVSDLVYRPAIHCSDYTVNSAGNNKDYLMADAMC